MLEKYSGQVTVKEILDMYDNDPESFFMDKTRTVGFLSWTICIHIVTRNVKHEIILGTLKSLVACVHLILGLIMFVNPKELI